MVRHPSYVGVAHRPLHARVIKQACKGVCINSQSGITLIELIITLLLSLVIFSAFTSILMSANQLFIYTATRAEDFQQESLSGRVMQNEISLAGYMGCGKLTNSFPLVSHVAATLSLANRLLVQDHRLEIRHAGLPPVRLISIHPGNRVIEVENGVVFHSNDIIILSDCHHAEIDSISKVQSHGSLQQLYLTVALSDHFDDGAEVSHFMINEFVMIQADSNKKMLVMRDKKHNQTVLMKEIENVSFSWLTDRLLSIKLAKRKRVITIYALPPK